MSFKKVFSAAYQGINPILINVEVSIDSRAFPAFNIVGLASKEVEESKERVKSAIKNCGFKFPNKSITVNLAPANLVKKGSMYDLSIALGILGASGQINFSSDKTIFIGELGLNGQINKAGSVFSFGVLARELKMDIFLPPASLREVSILSELKYFTYDNLIDLVNGFDSRIKHNVISLINSINEIDYTNDSDDLKFIKGQEFMKRALEISAAGNHNLGLFGPPGVGKTLVAKALQGIMPDLSQDELIEVNKIYSVHDRSSKNNFKLIRGRPYRNPLPSCTKAAMLGGGLYLKPGELSLAHKGILFLDEFMHFDKDVINGLRIPMEEKYVNLQSNKESYQFPADFLLVIASNLCPCGNLGDPQKDCICSDIEIKKYRKNLSGPLLDRLDLYVECLPVEKMDVPSELNDSKTVKVKVTKAAKMQSFRFQGSSLLRNSEISADNIDKFIPVNKECRDFLDLAKNKMNLSMRGCHKILKVARTIADLEGADEVIVSHLSEAIQYRPHV